MISYILTYPYQMPFRIQTYVLLSNLCQFGAKNILSRKGKQIQSSMLKRHLRIDSHITTERTCVQRIAEA